MADITSADVWKAIESVNFMVVGMVSARGEARTAGVMHVVHEGVLWFTTNEREHKARHLAANPGVSVTVPIPKRIPFMPKVKIPAASVTFSGVAEIVPTTELPGPVYDALVRGLEVGDGDLDGLIGVRVRPTGDFVTYGVGVSLQGMRDTELARGRVASAPAVV